MNQDMTLVRAVHDATGAAPQHLLDRCELVEFTAALRDESWAAEEFRPDHGYAELLAAPAAKRRQAFGELEARWMAAEALVRVKEQRQQWAGIAERNLYLAVPAARDELIRALQVPHADTVAAMVAALEERPDLALWEQGWTADDAAAASPEEQDAFRAFRGLVERLRDLESLYGELLGSWMEYPDAETLLGLGVWWQNPPEEWTYRHGVTTTHPTMEDWWPTAVEGIAAGAGRVMRTTAELHDLSDATRQDIRDKNRRDNPYAD